jgi:Raf kinase inhibitor-like YbhB/YbcL family protein
MKPAIGIVLLLLVLACSAGCTGAENTSPAMAPTIEVTSPAFSDGGSIPPLYTCDSDDISPALNWTGVPPDAVSLALVMDDPDAPSGTFTHWLVWDISPGTGGLPEGVAEGEHGIVQGTNGLGAIGYAGPCPPSGVHHYRFRIFALDDVPALERGAGRGEVDLAVEGHIIAWGELQGTYGRG